jgi:hypothetical protein
MDPTPAILSNTTTPEHNGQPPPTTSHVLAEESARLQVTAGTDRPTTTANNLAEVSDITWKDSHVAFQNRIIGMSHEDYWVLLRRFNYLVFRVTAVGDPPRSTLDMETTEDEKMSPKQIQAQLARLYMTVLVKLVIFWNQVARLRSWAEPRRTLAFLLVYVVAWVADLLVPALFMFLAAIIVFPPLRPILFPPVPPSIINAKTGGLKKPPAGVMASETSVTAAPESHKGEAVELEAHSFLTSVAEV